MVLVIPNPIFCDFALFRSFAPSQTRLSSWKQLYRMNLCVIQCSSNRITSTLFHRFILQSPESVRWARRKAYIHCLATTRPPTAMSVGISPDLIALLLDRRIAGARHGLITSPITGAVVVMLSDCCDTPTCPRAERVKYSSQVGI